MKLTSNSISVLVALALLAGMAVARATRPAPADVAPYHERVRVAVDSMPFRIGDWVGTDVKVPESAVQLLQPNVMLNRQYRNVETGRVVTLLLVHCRDARDLAGHYPPVCYPAHGWTQDSSEPHDWTIGDLVIPGTEYRFSFKRPTETRRVTVADFMVLPGGPILRDMKGVRRVADDYTQHFLGAAQIQLLMDATIPVEERDAIVCELVAGVRPAIDAIRADPMDAR
jgi:hypothetical protein